MKIETDNWKDIMETKGCISILLCLKQNGPMMKTELYSKVSRNTSMPDKIRALENHGVLRTYHYGKITMVELTDAGVAVAAHLVKIGMIMDGMDPPTEDADGFPYPG